MVSGALGIVLLLLLMTVTARSLDSLPILGAGARYRAEFSEAAGLNPGNEVRIAGVKVGKVSAVELDGDRVQVRFRVDDAWVGDQTTASIQIKTVLGQKYLALDPKGTDHLDPDHPIPLERTTSPYDVMEAFSQATDTVGEIDTDRLAESMRTLTEAFSATPDEFRTSVDAVARLSETIASRDQTLRRLLASAANTSGVLADRDAQFTRLIGDAADLLDELAVRKQALSDVLDGTARVSRSLRELVAQNRDQLGPALAALDRTTDILNANMESIRSAMTLYEPFVRLYTNVVGNGRWFDQVVVNVLPPGVPLVPGDRAPARWTKAN